MKRYGESLATKQFYPTQTKIFEGRTNFSECLFEALFKGSYPNPKSGNHTLEKCFEKALGKVCSAFENLRLGRINYAISHPLDEQKLQKGNVFFFEALFSMVRGPNH